MFAYLYNFFNECYFKEVLFQRGGQMVFCLSSFSCNTKVIIQFTINEGVLPLVTRFYTLTS